MGDRALVTFTDGQHYSPVIYTHWAGDSITDWLKDAAPRFRKGDISYAAARFCAYACEKTDGALSVGLMDAPTEDNLADIDKYSHGDAGVFIVDLETGKVTCGGGYAKSFQIDPATFYQG